jgi:RNA-directed DNA polymerase
MINPPSYRYPGSRGSGCARADLEPILEADFQPGSYGYRLKRTAHDAIRRVAESIVREKTRIIDIDLRA